MSQSNFSKILLAAIEEGLSSLGESPMEAILYHLEASFQLKKEEIPSNLPEFKRALEKIFGPGTPFLEKMITRCLYEKLGLSFEEAESIDLLTYVDNAKKRIVTEMEVK